MLRIPYKQTRLQVCQNMSEILRLLTRHSLVFLTAFCSLRIYLIDRTDIEAKRKSFFSLLVCIEYNFIHCIFLVSSTLIATIDVKGN